jgi:hypothetical protein
VSSTCERVTLDVAHGMRRDRYWRASSDSWVGTRPHTVLTREVETRHTSEVGTRIYCQGGDGD